VARGGGYEVGSAFLTIMPSADGFTRNLANQINGPMTQAGHTGGRSLASGVSSGASTPFVAAGRSMGGLFAGAFAAIAGANIIGAVTGFLGDAINAASDLAETQAKTGEIFGDSADDIIAYSKTAASSLGQSQQTVLDGASTFGIFGKSAGLAGDDLSEFSTGMVELATDLASFNNTSPEEAIQAIGAALRGESEPIRSYGVLLDDATLKARAFALGIADGTSTLTPQQKVLAAHAEILAQTGTAQGDFARTSEGLANQQRILAAEVENAKVEIGTALLPVVTDLFRVFVEVGLPVLKDVAKWFSENEETVRTLTLTVVDGTLSMIQAYLGFMEHMSRMQDFFLTVGSNMVQAWLNVVGFILDGAERAFGWVPGLGDKLKSANEDFDQFRLGVDETFTTMREAADKTTQTFIAGQDAVQGLRDKVKALDGQGATVFLNAQGNLVDKLPDGALRVRGSQISMRAGGGPVVAGRPYIVGEREAELFVPDRSGWIYNQSQLAQMGAGGSSGGDVFNIYEQSSAEATAIAVQRRQAAAAV
jgi:hypothetical protein